MSINSVADQLGLSVHQLRRWELMFGLEIKRGRGQQRQYTAEDLSALERIRELVEQGWPTNQIRPQLEAEGLVTPKLVGFPAAPNEQEALMESLIGLRNFTERRLLEISKQLDELRQLVIATALKQELKTDSSAWQSTSHEFLPDSTYPAKEIEIGPLTEQVTEHPISEAAPKKKKTTSMGLGELTDQNYLTVLGRALDLIGWTDEQADTYSSKTFNTPHWDELGKSQAETLIDHLQSLYQKHAPEDQPASA